MPIDPATLEATVRAYVGSVTSIRGRRVHRLLMRVQARYEHVLVATAENGDRVTSMLRSLGART